MALLRVDPEFRIHTSYRNDFFLLRTRVLVNGDNTEIKEDSCAVPVLNFCHFGSTVSAKLFDISKSVTSTVTGHYGVYHVDTFYYEQSPLFHVVFTSESCLRRFLVSIGEVKSVLEKQLQTLFLQKARCNVLETFPPAQNLAVEVQPELFLASPNQRKANGAAVHLITAENCSAFVTQWKDSMLFDFASLYQQQADPPQVITHPKGLENAVPGQPVTFTVHAIGTEPLKYQWRWTLVGSGNESEKEEWQWCDVKRPDKCTLTISSVQKSNEGSYHCIISNCVGSQSSEPAILSVAEPPRITTHPQEVKDVAPGKVVTFTIGTIGTEPLSYQWQWKPAGESGDSEEWQLCDVEGTQTAVLSIPSVQKWNEGQYRCNISNCAGSQTSNTASLSLAEGPRITTHPQELNNVVADKSVTLTIHATGTEPLMYRWQWIPLGDGREEWLQCDVSNSASLNIPNVQKSNEGIYHCVVSNWAGIQTSKSAKLSIADLPQFTSHPKELKYAVPGQSVTFAVHATGTEPISYQWQWKQAGSQQGESEDWQLCDVECSDGSTLKIPNVQKSNEGSYRCVISNCTGSQTSNAADLNIADPPQVITHPLGLKDAVPGQPVTFTVRATGTEPISYQWQWKPPGDVQEGSEEWQLCDVECSDGSTLKIPNVQKSNEGSYRCVISNCNGSQTSIAADLNIADPPQVTTHPQGLKDAVPGQPVTFTVHATGTEPISYQWRWTLVESGNESEKEEWQWCDVKRSGSCSLTISSVHKSNEGRYHCIISNCAGSQNSDPAILSVAEPPRITTHPQEVKDVALGKPVTFTVGTTGTEPLSYQWQWKPAGENGSSEEWQLCDVEGAELSIPRVQKWNEGQYRCNISNCAGSQTSNTATLSLGEPSKINTHPKELMGIFPGKPVSFTVQTTGTEPLKCQWQWKPAGDEGEWLNICCEGSSFQKAETGLEVCNAGYYRCVVSNSAGSETPQCTNLVVAAELADLVNELQEVNNWIPFGLNLGIDSSRLEAIEKERPTIGERRTQLFIDWKKQVVPTWSAVVTALMAIGMRRLASEIAQRHGVPVPEQSDDEPLQLVNLPQQGKSKTFRPELLAEVQKRRQGIRMVDVERTDTKKRLKDSQQSKASIDENINKILCSISKLRDKVQVIAHERNSTRKELESKQRECQLLSEMRDMLAGSVRDSKKQNHRFWKKDQEKDRQLQEKEVAYRMLLEEKIAKKKKKIEILEEKLQQKDSELQSAQQEAKSLDEKLSQARVELDKKHKEVKQLQKENEELTCSYNIEKEKVSKLVQVTVALTADKKKIEQQLISAKDESEFKSQQIEDCNSNITSLSKKVEALSCSLKEKEASTAQLLSELRSSHHEVSSTTEQLLELLKLQPQIAELEHKLQEAEYEKQQAVLEKRAVVQEMEARHTFKVQLCAQLELIPYYKGQEQELKDMLHQKLRKGDKWFLVDVEWLKQWKKYVECDPLDQSGQPSANPGPIDNANLFKDPTSNVLKEHMVEELDYSLLPEAVWNKLIAWYGLSQGSRPIGRKVVVEDGLHGKHPKMEVYLLEFSLYVYPMWKEYVVKSFSRASTVGNLEAELTSTFHVVDVEYRVWHRYLTDIYEPLSDSNETLFDARFYSGQEIFLELKNKDGSWPFRDMLYGSLSLEARHNSVVMTV